MSRLFVTATGTDLGKTLVTAALVHQVTGLGRRAVALKPVASGVEPGHWAASDPGILVAAGGGNPTKDAVAAICPWIFEAPLSPDMAARREGRTLPLAEIVGFCRRETAAADIALVEGVGGVMSPIAQDGLVIDLAAALDFPLLLVAGSYLGTLSHVLTAVAAIRARGLRLAGIVVSQSAQEPAPLAETLESLARHLPGVPLRDLPRLAHPQPWVSSPSLTQFVVDNP